MFHFIHSFFIRFFTEIKLYIYVQLYRVPRTVIPRNFVIFEHEDVVLESWNFQVMFKSIAHLTYQIFETLHLKMSHLWLILLFKRFYKVQDSKLGLLGSISFKWPSVFFQTLLWSFCETRNSITDLFLGYLSERPSDARFKLKIKWFCDEAYLGDHGKGCNAVSDCVEFEFLEYFVGVGWLWKAFFHTKWR